MYNEHFFFFFFFLKGGGVEQMQINRNIKKIKVEIQSEVMSA